MSRMLVASRSCFTLSNTRLRWQAAHAALLGLCLSTPLIAAETPSAEAPETLLLPPTLVSAQVPPPALGEQAVELRDVAATTDSASLLRAVPGVSLNAAGGLSSLPAIRGLADDRLRVKVDGMDLLASCPNHMNPALSSVDPSQIGSIRVYAGVTPVSVGGDSIGGSILVDRAPPEFAEPGATSLNQGEVGAFFRSNNDARGGHVALMHASEWFNIRYAASTSRANNYMAGDDFKASTETGRPGKRAALDEVASTAYETRNDELSMALRLGEDLLELTLGQQQVPEELFPNQRMDMTDNTQKRASLRYLAQFDWGHLETQVYHEKVDHRMNFGPDKQFLYGDAPGMPMNSEGRTFGASVKSEIELSSRDLLRLGSEYQRYRLDDYWPASGTGGMGPGTFENINDGERDRAALYAEWERMLSATWTTQLGLRYERVTTDAGEVHGYADTNGMGMMLNNQRRDAAAFNASDRSQRDDNWDATALARYTHDAHLDIEFGLARKVRSPNLYERYTWSSWPMAAVMNNLVGDGNGYVGNVELQPEAAHILSTTFDWHSVDHRRALTVTPFLTYVDDYIDAVALPGQMNSAGQFNVLQYTNQSARLYGVDVSGRLPLTRNALGQWGGEALVNYSRGENRETQDELYNLMPLNATFALTQELEGWRNRLEMVTVQAKNDGSDVRNEIETAGYTLFNLRLSHQWDRLQLDLGVENLTDKFYYLPTGGTYTAQGRTMSMNGIAWGTAVPGMGRSYYTGVTVSF